MFGDLAILALIEGGRLRVEPAAGLFYAPRSNTPDKPIGSLTKKGYLRACINVGGKQMHFMVHRIVWVSVHGPCLRVIKLCYRENHERTLRRSAATGP